MRLRQAREQGRRYAARVVEMSREEIIPAVRCQMQQAEEKMQIAAKLLRTNGYPESADDVVRLLKQSRVWTQPDGFLHFLEQPDAPEGDAA